MSWNIGLQQSLIRLWKIIKKMPDKKLSKKDANAALDLIHNSLSCCKTAILYKLIDQLRAMLEFEHARCVYGDKNEFWTKKMRAFKLITSFPEEWEERYASKGYVLKDSIALAAFHNNGLFCWEDVKNHYADNNNTKLVANEAASLGLVNGWLYAQKGRQGSECAIISIAGTTIKNTARSRLILDYVLPHLAQAVKRINFANNKSYPKLTPRELEVLSWITKGKSAWEISVILNISNRTVEFHNSNILAKFDAVNSQQAVAIALDCGVLCL